MPAERTLPIPATHREFTVLVGGEPVPREHALQALSVVSAANHVAYARLAYGDGSAGGGDFALASAGLFDPGAEVEIQAGSGSDVATVFKGIVTGQRLRVRESAPSLLVVDCRHAATRLTRIRRSANFLEQTDSEAIESLLSAAALNAEVEATSAKHPQLVQHDCIDWDFIVARAQACGLMVCTRAADLAIAKPALGAAVAQLRFGATLLDFDGEIDARLQAGAVQVQAWNPADQAVASTDGEDPGFDAPGDFTPDALATAAGAATLPLRHATMDEAEAALLATATWQRAQAGLVRGRAKCAGMAAVLPGDTVTLAGLGTRFDGDAWVSGVRHEFDTAQGWKTHLQLGAPEPDDALAARLSQRPAARLLAPVAGLQCGVVTDLEDPAGEFRVRVRLPLVNAGDEGLWARVATLDAGKERGTVFRPELDDEVLVGFLDEDPRHPVVLGMLHSSAKAAPIAASSANDQKGYKSRAGIEWLFDDGKKSLTLKTPAGNQLVLDDDAGGITLKDANGNEIVLDANGISVKSATALALGAGTEGKLEANTTLDLKGTAAVKLAGGQISLG